MGPTWQNGKAFGSLSYIKVMLSHCGHHFSIQNPTKVNYYVKTQEKANLHSKLKKTFFFTIKTNKGVPKKVCFTLKSKKSQFSL